ncbi:MAG: aldo/keto reductase, partial [Planctomycetota bacterium]
MTSKPKHDYRRPQRPVVFGLWPLAGVTTIGVQHDTAIATLHQAFDSGIDAFDTAFSYGRDGESDRRLGSVLKDRGIDRDSITVISKVSQRYDDSGERYVDASPGQIVRDAEASLQRIGIDHFDLLMLHSPDPAVDIQASIDALEGMRERGLCDAIGVCNVNAIQFAACLKSAPIAALQCPLNVLQRDSLDTLVAIARRHSVDVYVFWTLMKGLLAGGIGRDHQFAAGDSRPGYDIFQGLKRESAHRVVDALGILAKRESTTIAQLAIGWAVSQPGITAALVGGHRPEQIAETAPTPRLNAEVLAEIQSMVDTATTA